MKKMPLKNLQSLFRSILPKDNNIVASAGYAEAFFYSEVDVCLILRQN